MKKFIGLVVVLCVVLCTLSVAAHESPNSTVTWTIENNVLTISGTGAMENYKNEKSIPWYDQRNDIKEIVIEDGITHIGDFAFYGMKNATKASIPDSVESIGFWAFNYTEGTQSSFGNIGAEYQFTLESDTAVVREGEDFTITLRLSGDFKDVSGIQSIIVFDKERVSIDKNQWYDPQWYSTVDDTNAGYISKPITGFVANTFRMLYVSLGGQKIDEYSPLYTKGETELVIAKVTCKALKDIADVNTSVFIIKECVVSKTTEENGVKTGTSGENQLTNYSRFPINGLKIETNNAVAKEYAAKYKLPVSSGTISSKEDTESNNTTQTPVPEVKDITVVAADNQVVFDTTPYVNEDNGVMIPLRAVMEQLGFSVIWDNETQTVFIANDTDFAAMQLGKKAVFKNNENFEITTESSAKDERTFVPIDFFSTVFGFETNWDNTSKTATIK